MSESLITSAVTVVLAIVGVAFIAVLVSKNANTAGVIGAGGNSLSSLLGTAEGPVSGGFNIAGFSGGAL